MAGSEPGQPDWNAIVPALRKALSARPTASVTEIAELGGTPFEVLISTIISLRTRDEVTLAASRSLFAVAHTPEGMVALSSERIAEIIYPAGFYRNKGKSILEISRLLIEEHGGAVPDSLDRLVALPGVGRKTANLVLGLGFGIPAICVDTHVHRIPNRAGWISTKTPEQSEQALEAILPKKYWIEINTLLVGYGQTICTPQSPRCSHCLIYDHCARVGVERSR